MKGLVFALFFLAENLIGEKKIFNTLFIYLLFIFTFMSFLNFCFIIFEIFKFLIFISLELNFAKGNDVNDFPRM